MIARIASILNDFKSVLHLYLVIQFVHERIFNRCCISREHRGKRFTKTPTGKDSFGFARVLLKGVFEIKLGL